METLRGLLNKTKKGLDEELEQLKSGFSMKAAQAASNPALNRTARGFNKGVQRVRNTPAREFFMPTSTPVRQAAQAGGQGLNSINSYLGLDRPVIQNQSFLGQAIDSPLRNLRAGFEVLNLPSYALGGALKSSREALSGDNKGNKYVHPALSGMFEGVTRKQPIFEELPKTFGVEPGSALGLGIGLAGEIATPDPLDTVRIASKGDDLASKTLKIAKEKGYQRGMIESLHKRIDHLLGGFGRGLSGNYKFDYKMRQNILSDSSLEAMGAPKKVVNEIKSLRDTLSELQDIRKTGSGIVREKAERVFKEQGKDVNRLKGLMSETPAQTKFRRNLGLKPEDVYQTADDIKQQFRAFSRVSPSNVIDDVDRLGDISSYDKGFKDVYRVFKKAFKDQFPKIKNEVLDPLDKGKKSYTDMMSNYSDQLQKNIVSNGIKKGSKESEALQLFGEGKLTLPKLEEMFGKEKARTIVNADKWFRRVYDELLDTVNHTRRQLYPNNPEMIIPKRRDYYRHFRDMDGMGGLKNIFENPAGIDPNLVGMSDYSLPRGSWLPFAQRRIGDDTTYDAVGGFLEYLKKASYSSQIDPHILNIRKLASEVVEKTGQVGEEQYSKLNNLIEFLEDYANDLSGKTNPIDRGIQKYIPGGRKAFKVIDWTNRRVKLNTILGNLSSSVAQIFNVPQGIASAGEKNFIAGAFDTVLSPLKKAQAIDESAFIKERYFNLSKFDRGLLNNTKKMASWVTGALDEFGTKAIWNAHYKKALSEGIENPIKYADDITRSLVAGRGIGEVPLVQKSKVVQLVAPFQLEVENLWHVMKDMADEKSFGKIAKVLFYNYLFNSASEQLVGRRITFDPIDAIAQAIGDESIQGDPFLMGGRVAGEVLSNRMFGQSMAALYPEYGKEFLGAQFPTREQLFGENDPTRFGSGLMVAKGIQDPLFKLAPPFGGGQIKKTLGGLDMLGKGYSDTPTGRARFAAPDKDTGRLKALFFGEYATDEAREYFDKGETPLGDKDTEKFIELVEKGYTPKETAEFLRARINFDDFLNKEPETEEQGIVKTWTDAIKTSLFGKKADKLADGDIDTIDSFLNTLNMDKEMTGEGLLNQLLKQDEWKKAMKKVIKSPNLDEETKMEIIGEMGGNYQDMFTEVIKDLPIEQRSTFIIESSPDFVFKAFDKKLITSSWKVEERADILESLMTRGDLSEEDLNVMFTLAIDKSVLTDNVVDEMLDRGYLTETESNKLKDLIDTVKSKGKKGKKGKAMPVLNLKFSKASTSSKSWNLDIPEMPKIDAPELFKPSTSYPSNKDLEQEIKNIRAPKIIMRQGRKYNFG